MVSNAPLGANPSISPTPPFPTPLDRRILARRLSYIVLVRVILFTLIIGGTVGVIMIAMYQPIFELAGNIRGQ